MKNPSDKDIDEEFDKQYELMFKKFRRIIIELQQLLEAITPVDTGFLREHWSRPKRIKKDILRISNPTEYAEEILIEGKSNQLPQGILPYIREYLKKRGDVS